MRIWLYAMAACVLLMVVVGGITRLTESGLSITSWKPISGTIPPLSDADWQAEFDAYKQIPQYEAVNSWMTINDFKFIFFWEWAHRLLGRLLGVLFIVPFLVFLVQKRLPRTLAWPLFGLFILGGFQGALGWWMVSSGLTELTSVSQYRLAAHLCAASLLFMALVYVPRSLEPGRTARQVSTGNLAAAFALLAAGLYPDRGRGLRRRARCRHGLQHLAADGWRAHPRRARRHGAAVAQSVREQSDGAVHPPLHRLCHRSLSGGAALAPGPQERGFAGVHAWLWRIGVLVLVQVVLGISTLLTSVQIDLAVAHQALAFMLAGTVVLYIADLIRVRTECGIIIPYT